MISGIQFSQKYFTQLKQFVQKSGLTQNIELTKSERSETMTNRYELRRRRA